MLTNTTRPAVVRGDLVDVDVAERLRVARHEEGVERLVGGLAGAEDILQPPQLELAGEVEPAGAVSEAHGALEILLVDRHGAVGLRADEEQLAGLVGGEGEAHAVARQPAREPARGREVERAGRGGRRQVVITPCLINEVGTGQRDTQRCPVPFV